MRRIPRAATRRVEGVDARAAGDFRPPPPHALRSLGREPLRAAAAGLAASATAATLPIGLRAYGRALLDAALAGASCTPAGARLAAAAAVTLRAADTLAAIEGRRGGHEPQRRPQQQTVHGKTPLHEEMESIGPRRDVRARTCRQGRRRFNPARRRTRFAAGGSARRAMPPHIPGSRREPAARRVRLRWGRWRHRHRRARG